MRNVKLGTKIILDALSLTRNGPKINFGKLNWILRYPPPSQTSTKEYHCIDNNVYRLKGRNWAQKASKNWVRWRDITSKFFNQKTKVKTARPKII